LSEALIWKPDFAIDWRAYSAYSPTAKLCPKTKTLIPIARQFKGLSLRLSKKVKDTPNFCGAVFVLLYVAFTSAAAGTKEITKTSRGEFNLPKEIVAFVSNLVETDPEVRNQYKKLTAATEEEAGGRFNVGDFVAIEWLVPNVENNFNDAGGTSDAEYVYLVKRQLIFGFHHGYSVNDNVVARVHVALHEEDEPDPKQKDKFAVRSSSLKMTFEGFVTVILKSDSSASSGSGAPVSDASPPSKTTNENIENDPRYAPLDVRLNKVYSALRPKLSPTKREELKQLERDFLNRRDQLKDNPDSFFALTEQQIAKLQEMLDTAH
jgi:uncharacterized protein YecT (DUF1311 family)